MPDDGTSVLSSAQNFGRERLILRASLVVIVVISFAVVASASVSYDGKWWFSIPEMQRKGFVHGFTLCYVHLVHGDTVPESYEAYESRLAEYLRLHPEARSTSLSVLLPKLAAPPYAHPVHRIGRGNETPRELKQKWGAHEDGDDWRGGGPWNLGYLQGFLECYSKHTNHPYGTFSKPVEWYVSAISGWYGTKEGDPSVINLAREKDKIPEVLFRFHDKSEASKAEKKG